MKVNKKFVVAIEETIVQEFEICADTAEKAMELAKEQYKSGVFILSPGETHYRQMAIVKPNKEVAEWHKF